MIFQCVGSCCTSNQPRFARFRVRKCRRQLKNASFRAQSFFVKITLINRLKTAGKLVVKGTAITVKHMCLKAFFLLFFVNTAANMCLIADYTTPKTRRFLKDVRSLESEHL